MKIRVIIVSKPLRANEATKFKAHFKDLFDGKFIFSGKYDRKRKTKKYPMYYVGYVPKKNIPAVVGFKKKINRDDLLSIVPKRNYC
jgi:hypothetical protein